MCIHGYGTYTTQFASMYIQAVFFWYHLLSLLLGLQKQMERGQLHQCINVLYDYSTSTTTVIALYPTHVLWVTDTWAATQASHQ